MDGSKAGCTIEPAPIGVAEQDSQQRDFIRFATQNDGGELFIFLLKNNFLREKHVNMNIDIPAHIYRLLVYSEKGQYEKRCSRHKNNCSNR